MERSARIHLLSSKFAPAVLATAYAYAGLGFQNLAQFSHMSCCPDPAKIGRREAERLLKRSGEMAVA